MIGTMNRIQESGQASQHAEGPLARTIEQQTAKLPSDIFLWAALGSMGVSCALNMMGKEHQSLFIGQWAAPLLLMGIYNKIVKVAGSDRMHSEEGGQSTQVSQTSWQPGQSGY